MPALLTSASSAPSPRNAAHLGDEALDLGGIGEIGGDVVRPVGIALAFGRHVLARGGDDAPAGLAEAAHRGVADAAAGAGEEEGLARALHPRSLGKRAAIGKRLTRVPSPKLTLSTGDVIASAAKQSPGRIVGKIAASPFGRLAMTEIIWMSWTTEPVARGRVARWSSPRPRGDRRCGRAGGWGVPARTR